MKRRVCAFLVLAVIAMLGFAGCFRSGDGNQSVLKVYNFRTEDQNYYDWMIKKFEDENEGITVEYASVTTEDYPTIINSKFTAEDVDVFGCQASYLDDEYYYSKMDPVDDLSFWDKITDYAIEACTLNGSKLFAPLSASTEIVFYNKDIFAELNLSVPTTWNEWKNVLTTLQANTGKTVDGNELSAPLIFGGREGWPLNMIVDSHEYSFIRAEYPKYYADMFVSGTHKFSDAEYLELYTRISYTLSFADSKSSGVSYARVPGNFASGSYAMIIDGSWSYKEIIDSEPDFEIGFFPLPANDDAEYNKAVGGKIGGGWGIAKTSKNKENAKKFIEFQMRDDIYQRYLDEVLMNSVRKDMQSSDQTLQELYSYETGTIFENYKVKGLQWDIASYALALFNGTRTPLQVVTSLEEMRESSAVYWEENVSEWLARWHPEYEGEPANTLE